MNCKLSLIIGKRHDLAVLCKSAKLPVSFNLFISFHVIVFEISPFSQRVNIIEGVAMLNRGNFVQINTEVPH